MKTFKHNQLEAENQAWERSLEFIKQENALLKYRLSEMVDYSDEKDFLQMAEYFQNELLLKDDALDKLIKELKNFPDKINGQNDNENAEKILYEHDKLRNKMAQLEEEFSQLSNEFNREMLKNSKH
jgi:ABC-type phosphate transport system auxiliary subunit